MSNDNDNERKDLTPYFTPRDHALIGFFFICFVVALLLFWVVMKAWQ